MNDSISFSLNLSYTINYDEFKNKLDRYFVILMFQKEILQFNH